LVISITSTVYAAQISHVFLSLLQCAGNKAVWIPDVVDGILLDRWPPNVRLLKALWLDPECQNIIHLLTLIPNGKYIRLSSLKCTLTHWI